MQFVYRYIDSTGSIVYVGITKHLFQRIKEHRKDKLSNFSGTIEYFAVSHREDADLIETYLINKWKPMFNVAKKQKGDVSFLGDGQLLPWIKFVSTEQINNTPFSIESLAEQKIVEKTITKTVTTYRPSTEQVISEADKYMRNIFNDYEIAKKRLKVLRGIKNLIPEGNIPVLNKERMLLLRVLWCLRKLKNTDFIFNVKLYKHYRLLHEEAIRQLEDFYEILEGA